ncbi:MAG: helix-turn-helix transcriptional regulator [Desulfamplus sp.]|nr:helix-turn-helix transcriptional regulator [Desulfamplus sp.]
MDIHALQHNNFSDNNLTYCYSLTFPPNTFNPQYPISPTNFGEMLRQIRFDMGLQIKAFAMLIDVLEDTFINWEVNRVLPSFQQLKKIAEWLNTNKQDTSLKNKLFQFYFAAHKQYPKNTDSFGDKLRAIRMQQLLSIKELAKKLNFDTSTLQKWETEQTEPLPELKKKVLAWIDNILY